MSDIDVSFDSDATTDSHTTTSDFEETRGVYANEEQADHRGQTLYSQPGDSSDEVDPRKLLRDPTLSELRWYYRREMGGIIVKKPIKDAFKNSFTLKGDNAEEARTLFDGPDYLQDGDVIDAHIMAEIKARRDGFSLLFLGVQDNSGGIHTSPVSSDVEVDDITHVDVKTIDDLTPSAAPHEDIIDGVAEVEGREDYEVRDTGIVVNTMPNSPNFHDPIGYVLGSSPAQFIHADRVIHYVWNRDVDGPYEHDSVARFDAESTLGEWEGDSVLIASYDLLKGVSKGNWAVMQALFRHASHMYSVELPDDATDEDLQSALTVTQNINAKSALVVPDGWEVDQKQSGGEMNPEPYFDVIFDQLCANHEMTRSVLFGTQTGTVSGSETDIKNYFNKVERYRSNRGEDKLRQYLTQAKRILDGRTDDAYEFGDYRIEWGPLFKVDRQNRIAMFQNHTDAVSTLIKNYILTPDEARSILTEEWAEVDLDSLGEDQMDVLDRIVLANMGQGEWAEANDPSPDQMGRPEGARNEPESSETTPTGDDSSQRDGQAPENGEG